MQSSPNLSLLLIGRILAVAIRPTGSLLTIPNDTTLFLEVELSSGVWTCQHPLMIGY